jgi:hypothetical protein
MTWPLKDICQYVPEHDWQPSVLVEAGPLEFNAEFIAVRDHYTTVAEAALDLTKALGLTAKPSTPILRRM